MLEELYSHEPKLDEYEMHEEMSKMRDERGGLMFSYRNRGDRPPSNLKKSSKAFRDWRCKVCKEHKCVCAGMLLSLDQIRGWISSFTQRQKKKRKHNEICSGDDDIAED